MCVCISYVGPTCTPSLSDHQPPDDQFSFSKYSSLCLKHILKPNPVSKQGHWLPCGGSCQGDFNSRQLYMFVYISQQGLCLGLFQMKDGKGRLDFTLSWLLGTFIDTSRRQIKSVIHKTRLHYVMSDIKLTYFLDYVLICKYICCTQQE